MAGVLTSPGRNPLGDAFEFFADLKRVVRSGSQSNSDPTDPPLKNTNSSECQVRCTATDLALSEHIGEMTLETESLDKFTHALMENVTLLAGEANTVTKRSHIHNA